MARGPYSRRISFMSNMRILQPSIMPTIMITLVRDTTHNPEGRTVSAKAIHHCPHALDPKAVHAGRHMTRSR